MIKEARTALIKVRVTPFAAAAFAALCKERGTTVSDAMREALKDWTRKNTTPRSRRPAMSETNLDRLIQMLDPETMRGAVTIPPFGDEEYEHEYRVSAFPGYENLPLDDEFGFSVRAIRHMLAYAKADAHPEAAESGEVHEFCPAHSTDAMVSAVRQNRVLLELEPQPCICRPARSAESAPSGHAHPDTEPERGTEGWEACWEAVASAAWPNAGATRPEVLDMLLSVRPGEACTCGGDWNDAHDDDCGVFTRPAAPVPVPTVGGETERWDCGPHANAWNGHDARCRRVPTPPAEPAQGGVPDFPGSWVRAFADNPAPLPTEVGDVERESLFATILASLTTDRNDPDGDLYTAADAATRAVIAAGYRKVED